MTRAMILPVNVSFLDCDVPRRPSYRVYISQLIMFARVCSQVTDFNAQNKSLTAKLLSPPHLSYSSSPQGLFAIIFHCFNPITVNSYAALFNCTPVDRASDSMMAPT